MKRAEMERETARKTLDKRVGKLADDLGAENKRFAIDVKQVETKNGVEGQLFVEENLCVIIGPIYFTFFFEKQLEGESGRVGEWEKGREREKKRGAGEGDVTNMHPKRKMDRTSSELGGDEDKCHLSETR